jgi:hypothetical protein
MASRGQRSQSNRCLQAIEIKGNKRLKANRVLRLEETRGLKRPRANGDQKPPVIEANTVPSIEARKATFNFLHNLRMLQIS